ncbi:SEP-domain-containing protein [Mycena venus]|uniref:SEP-domain-containing protein n=1 Tax=Mycena venus TaxID=2733690 RepID=A0A8H6YKC1_9AGAR|nr:SEP-domain-containing protein [Mycena venus]
MSGHSDDDDEQETWFAGGERSGISVQNPGRGRGGGPGGDLVRDLLRRAQEEGASGPGETTSARPGFFTGGGHTLGGEGASSAYVPGERVEQEDELAIRRLTFWRDGFTVEDGALMRYDDPANADVLAAIHAGHAPPSILNVRHGQRVDVQVTKRTDEDYIPPKVKPFSGTGNRLGAPVPAAAPPASTSSTSSSGGAAGASSITPRFEVDQSQPTTSVQIRLADGTRIVCRMNLTHTVRDLRNFINAARPENLTRPYTIGTTFPNRTLDDDGATIDGAGLKNSVIVQRWV